MKTASFFTFTGAGRISIARWAPRDVPAGFRTFRPLAPGPWFKSVDRDEYQRRYVAQLAPLDPAQVWDELHRLAAPAEPVLLCWERPADLAAGKAFCHRRMVAQWFDSTLGLLVPELHPPQCPPASDRFAGVSEAAPWLPPSSPDRPG